MDAIPSGQHQGRVSHRVSRFAISQRRRAASSHARDLIWFTVPANRLPDPYVNAFQRIADGSGDVDPHAQVRLRRVVAEVLTGQLSVFQYLACLDAFRALALPAGHPHIARQLRLALGMVTASPSEVDSLRVFDLVWWFLGDDHWMKAKEKDLMRDLRQTDAIRGARRRWPAHMRTVAQALGVSFAAFRAAILVRLVLLRLAHTVDPIRQIASDLGYSHESAMNRHFKSMVGMSPRTFRQLVRGTTNAGGVLGKVLPYRPKGRWIEVAPAGGGLDGSTEK